MPSSNPKNNTKVTVYTPESSFARPWELISSIVADLSAGQELARQLALRDIRAQYRQTALGLLWAFILPLANTAAWLFINSSGIVSIKETSLPYPVFVLTGTILWSIFMDSVNAPLQHTNAAKPMLAKINFPREAIILSGIYQTLFNAGIKIGVLMAALLFLGTSLDWRIILFPLCLCSLVITGTAIGVFITPIGMLYTDIGKGLPLLFQFMMFVTPVVFPIPTQGWAALIMTINPITPLIITARDTLTGGRFIYMEYFFGVTSIAILMFCMLWVIYRAVMPTLIERMSA